MLGLNFFSEILSNYALRSLIDALVNRSLHLVNKCHFTVIFPIYAASLFALRLHPGWLLVLWLDKVESPYCLIDHLGLIILSTLLGRLGW